MKYALLIYGDESIWDGLDEAERAEVYAAHDAYTQQLVEAGVMAGGAELAPSDTATSVRFEREGCRLVDGPFAELREQLGGFYLIDVPDLDAALDWARRMPGLDGGCVEVRPIGLSDD